jgi:hypothetical protein
MRNINSLCTSSRFIDHVILMGFRDIFELLLDKDPRFEIKKFHSGLFRGIRQIPKQGMGGGKGYF